MKIAICGSMTFAKQMIEIKEKLEASGHEVIIPHGVEEFADGTISVEDKWIKIENDLIRNWHKVIESSDGILILNYTKNGIDNYIGGNSLIEMASAYILYKKIFLLNPVPVMSYTDEIESFNPIVLYGDLSGIKLSS
ncbi:MAG: hypothetical protein WCW47_03600 [Candidatus Paceibacterota bacterium]|jgi:hypothetical protein